MNFKPYKVRAVAQLLGVSTDVVRRMVDESGIHVERQNSGPMTRMFSVQNTFDLARYSATRKAKYGQGARKQVVAAVYSPKSRVGKTTLTANFSICSALHGLKTLTIDLDPQANLTSCFGYDPELTLEHASEVGMPSAQLVEFHFGSLMPNWPSGRRTLDKIIKKPYGENGPHLIPADLTLDGLDTVLARETRDERPAGMAIADLFRQGRAKNDSCFDISSYDVVLFDAPSSMNRITRDALLASDYVICPVSTESHSTKALSYLFSVLSEMREQYGRSPELIVVGNFFDSGRPAVSTHLSMIMQTYRQSLPSCWIRRSEDFYKTPDNEPDVPLVLSKPGCGASDDLRNSADALLTYMRLAGT